MYFETASMVIKMKTKLDHAIRAFIYCSFDSNIAIKCLKQRVIVTKYAPINKAHRESMKTVSAQYLTWPRRSQN